MPTRKEKKVEEVIKALKEQFGGDEEKLRRMVYELDSGELSSLERTVNEGVAGKEEKPWSRFLRKYVTGST